MQRNVKMDPPNPITIFTTTGEKKMNDNGALLVLCGPLFSLFAFSIPPFNYKTPSSPILSCNFSSMEFRPRNGFNLEEDDTAGDDRKRRSGGGGKRGGPGTGGAAPPCCQADACPAVLTDAKRYHRRHKVCEFHAKSAVVLVAGLRQRFCQQCSRFHELSEFDEAKRSCRRRLAGHNERRRKSSSTEPLGDGSTPATSRLGSSSSSSSGIGGQIQCRASTDENSRASGISLPTASNSSAAAAAYKQHLQIG